MANAIISDTTGKTISRDVSYLVDVYSRSTGTHIKIDTEMIPELKHLIALGLQNGAKHTKWNKETKKFEELYSEIEEARIQV